MCQIHNRFVASGKATEIAFRNASSLSVKIPFDLYQAIFETLHSTVVLQVIILLK